jgi:hypothetical protein
VPFAPVQLGKNGSFVIFTSAIIALFALEEGQEYQFHQSKSCLFVVKIHFIVMGITVMRITIIVSKQ